ncbi:MAG: pimeloyl-ACP methyl ester carboxylesterase [Planctomycetota bacterium]|jgi:pimeloyl-ACP methyl ester carboxylesterase
MSTTQTPFEITYEDEPTRVIRGSVERPDEAGDEPLPWVLLMHGFKGFMDWGFFPLLSCGLATAGFQVVRFNQSGSGVGADGKDFSDLEAFAKDTYGRQLEDMARVSELVSAGELGAVDAERAGLFGHSRGGGMGIVHAAEVPYCALVTWAAIDDADRFDEATKAQWREAGSITIKNARTKQDMRMDLGGLLDFEANVERYDILAAAARVEAPVQLIHGDADESVHVDAVNRLERAFPHARKTILKGASHTLGATHPLSEMPEALAQALAITTEHFLLHL